jgi:hypothetical protein
LLAGADRTAFITAAFPFWWPMWRDGKGVVVTEQLLVAERLATRFDPANPYAAIPEDQASSEDGWQVSPMRLGVADIRDFIDRRAGSYTPT